MELIRRRLGVPYRERDSNDRRVFLGYLVRNGGNRRWRVLLRADWLNRAEPQTTQQREPNRSERFRRGLKKRAAMVVKGGLNGSRFHTFGSSDLDAGSCAP